MSVDRFQEAIEKLRGVELRRAVRGVDPEQVRALLHDAAELLVAAGRERNELRIELRQEREANHEETVGLALLTATRAGEALLADAREKAAAITAGAEAQASQLREQLTAQVEKREQEAAAERERFERELTVAKEAVEKEHQAARAEAEAALGDARRELAGLESQAAQLRSLVSDMERRIVEIARGALAEIEAFDATTSGTTQSDLLADLQPAGGAGDGG